ncbi:hypothetical protein L7F22_056017 [Adiantum nelumboides]|nr:hypothetical protein [Adiantum nelumboides]
MHYECIGQEMRGSSMEERERGEEERGYQRGGEDYYGGFAEIDGSSEVLRMKMDAMTWAAKAKDAEVAALQAAIREGRDRERRLEAELAGLKARLERAELAEEHLAAEIADLEADAFERASWTERAFEEVACGRLEGVRLQAQSEEGQRAAARRNSRKHGRGVGSRNMLLCICFNMERNSRDESQQLIENERVTQAPGGRVDLRVA